MIKIKNLNKIFYENTNKEFYALKDINLNIKKSSCVVLKGVSGSGKSTLLSLIATLQKPTSGEIVVENESIAKLPDFHASNFRARKIGFIFQSFNLFNELSVKDNISLPLIPLGFSQKQIDEKVINTLKLANILHKKDELVSNLSGGEKQRCAIARALVNDCEIILCDEPTANLDYENSKNFIEILKELKELKKTIIIATHDPIFDNLDFVDSEILIKNGQICE
ncbi:ABC transporter ATP-binding protein [Aliarcobacter butzleri]|jgi:putative ABC transport system ATP-binding protein|uniref:ABC transporter ATP-binding protein n=2 Tax=Aliarcobacter butzleri TaxID=28197 RepID=A0AAW7PX06_9BACT|nr:ABC transporter ATP-binding protein [Aliarcobacter butzleri]KLE01732.1 ABC transporter ATP-binding protein [Aliarcobacter butzleri L348]MCG3666681.1 ABC transporter ATP-binding protein [Aliarcobacter butzleri]MDK2063981.1 ABC transporter ATP-binding protein [Aliarcobacter butzleri]MDN5054993.1 ABC transporter ATP-binding protein [Aliarcobacter butzleri]MDN5070216.1 ABC transporter ATP-binding protein [Aliarcobacter butzleri]